MFPQGNDQSSLKSSKNCKVHNQQAAGQTVCGEV